MGSNEIPLYKEHTTYHCPFSDLMKAGIEV